MLQTLHKQMLPATMGEDGMTIRTQAEAHVESHCGSVPREGQLCTDLWEWLVDEGGRAVSGIPERIEHLAMSRYEWPDGSAIVTDGDSHGWYFGLHRSRLEDPEVRVVLADGGENMPAAFLNPEWTGLTEMTRPDGEPDNDDHKVEARPQQEDGDRARSLPADEGGPGEVEEGRAEPSDPDPELPAMPVDPTDRDRLFYGAIEFGRMLEALSRDDGDAFRQGAGRLRAVFDFEPAL